MRPHFERETRFLFKFRKFLSSWNGHYRFLNSDVGMICARTRLSTTYEYPAAFDAKPKVERFHSADHHSERCAFFVFIFPILSLEKKSSLCARRLVQLNRVWANYTADGGKREGGSKCKTAYPNCTNWSPFSRIVKEHFDRPDPLSDPALIPMTQYQYTQPRPHSNDRTQRIHEDHFTASFIALQCGAARRCASELKQVFTMKVPRSAFLASLYDILPFFLWTNKFRLINSLVG